MKRKPYRENLRLSSNVTGRNGECQRVARRGLSVRECDTTTERRTARSRRVQACGAACPDADPDWMHSRASCRAALYAWRIVNIRDSI